MQRAKPRTWVSHQPPPPAHTFSLTSNCENPTNIVGQLPEKKKRRGKKQDKVYPGVELPSNRWIKRAWTKVPITSTASAMARKDKKDKREQGNNKLKDQHVQKGSLLFQTTLPTTNPSPAHTDSKVARKLETKRKRLTTAAEAVTGNLGSEETGSDSESEKKHKKQKAKKIPDLKIPKEKITVKEFTRSQRFPGFLKTSHLDPNNKKGKVKEFVEGLGWVDDNGDVVDDSAVKRAGKQGSALGAGGIKAKSEVGADKPTKPTKANKEGDNKNVDEDEDIEDSHQEQEPNQYVAEKGTHEKVQTRQASQERVTSSNNDDNTSVESEFQQSHSGFDSDEHEVEGVAGEGVKGKVKEADTLRPSPSRASAKPETATSSISSTLVDSEDNSSEHSEGEDTSCASDIDASEVESERERAEVEEDVNLLDAPKLPSLKLAIPSNTAPEGYQPHPLEALFKPTTTAAANDAGSSLGNLFDFGLADEDQNESNTQLEILGISHKRPYRSAAPTPDTAVVSKAIRWPDPATVPSFQPTTPIASQNFTHQSLPGTGDTDAPLLFQGTVDSAYLRGLSIWAGSHLPEAKGVTELPVETEEAENSKALKKLKRNANEMVIGKHKERKIGQGSVVARSAETRKEIWKERFFKYRGEWNREWKNKKREAGKLARRRRRERGIGIGAAGST